jgi:transposase InsO family protein
VRFGTKKFRTYSEHQEFILETDNQALSWLLSHPRQLGKIGRWATKISALKFQVRHICGMQNIVADTLSRMFEFSPAEESNLASCNLTLTNFPLAFHYLKQLQLQDPELLDIRNRLSQRQKIDHYRLSKGLLYWHSRKGRSQKLVVLASVRPMIFAYFHDSPLGGQLGVFKTLSKISEYFMWKGMDKEVHDKVHQCHTCSLSKPAQNTRFGLLSSEAAQRPMRKLLIDFVGKFPRSKAGNTAILVCVDAFSKFVWMIPVREGTTRATIKALKERIFSIFSLPEILVSDNAQCFASREFWHFCFEIGVKHVTTTPYYPQPSHAERFNRNLRAALIAYHHDAHDTWDQQLPWLQLAFNTAEHESTKSTPFAVIFPFGSGSPLLIRWTINELLPVKWNKGQLRQKRSRLESG